MRTFLLVLAVAVGSAATGYLLSRYFLRRANLKPSHKGLLVGAFGAAGVVLVHVILKEFGIDLWRGVPNQIMWAALALPFLGAAARLIFVRLGSGPELTDLGPAPLRTIYLVFGPLFAAFAIVGLLAGELAAGQGIFCLSQGLWFVAMGRAHSKIVSRGILYGGDLLPWSRIGSYEWDRTTLTLTLQKPRWWHDRIQVPVPAVLVDQVDTFMRQHVGASA